MRAHRRSRRIRFGVSWTILLLNLASWTPALAASTSDTLAGSRAIGVVPLAQNSPEKYASQRAQSYGVFVGVDQFPGDPSIVALKFAAADAQAMRDCFAGELGYLPPENTRLLITGATGDDAPTRSNILKAIKFAADSAGADGCVVVDLSTHGIEGYVLAEDSQRAILQDSAIPLRRVEDYLKASRSPRRLLFFDACREKVADDGQRALSGGMSEEFAKAFASTEGFVVLMSCDQGQFSYEMPEQGHGAFTYFLLEGLRGGAPAGPDGLITAASLANWVKQRVEDWSRTKPSGKQSPRFELQQATGDFPLAVSRARLEEQSQHRQQLAQAAQTLSKMFAEGKLTAEQHAQAQAALVSKDEQRQKLALDIANGTVASQYIGPLLFQAATPTPSIPSTPSPTPAPTATPSPAPVPERTEPKANRPPTVDEVKMPKKIEAGGDVSFEIVASDPDGDPIAKYFYRLDGQKQDSLKTSPKIALSKLRSGSRSLTVAAEDARGARSEPKTVEFTVAQAEAAPTPTRAAATPQTTKPPKATLAGQWKMNISKSRDPVRASFQRFLEQYAKEQGYPYVDPTFNANATQLFENMVWTSDGGAVLSLNTTDGRNFSFDYRNPSSGGVFTVKSASKDGTSLTVTGPMGQRITVDLQSSNTILASIHYPPALATQIVGFSASGGLTTQEYWDRVQ